ncbi:MAG: hypothetical protein ACI4MP_00615 [Candidatus Ventricola sp.]
MERIVFILFHLQPADSYHRETARGKTENEKLTAKKPSAGKYCVVSPARAYTHAGKYALLFFFYPSLPKSPIEKSLQGNRINFFYIMGGVTAMLLSP